MNRIYIIMVALLAMAFASADEIRSDLIRLNEKISSADNYKVSVRVIYEYGNLERVDRISSVVNGTNIMYSYMGARFINNSDLQLLINADEKVIVVQDSDQPDEDEDIVAIEPVSGIDTMIKKELEYKFIRKQGDLQTISINFGKDDLYTGVEITYDTKNQVYKSLEYKCGKRLKETGLQRIRVLYDEFDFSPSIDNRDFSEENYIKKRGKKILGPSDKYKGYTVIDQRLDP